MTELTPKDRTITFTGEQLNEVRNALAAREAETIRYLRAYDTTTTDFEHDACCPVAAARRERRDSEREVLRRRKQVLNGCLAHTGPVGGG